MKRDSRFREICSTAAFSLFGALLVMIACSFPAVAQVPSGGDAPGGGVPPKPGMPNMAPQPGSTRQNAPAVNTPGRNTFKIGTSAGTTEADCLKNHGTVRTNTDQTKLCVIGQHPR